MDLNFDENYFQIINENKLSITNNLLISNYIDNSSTLNFVKDASNNIISIEIKPKGPGEIDNNAYIEKYFITNSTSLTFNNTSNSIEITANILDNKTLKFNTNKQIYVNLDNVTLKQNQNSNTIYVDLEELIDKDATSGYLQVLNNNKLNVNLLKIVDNKTITNDINTDKLQVNFKDRVDNKTIIYDTSTEKLQVNLKDSVDNKTIKFENNQLSIIQNELAKLIQQYIKFPIGHIFPYIGNDYPREETRICNGQTIDCSSLPEFYQWAVANNLTAYSNRVQLPDLTDCVLWGTNYPSQTGTKIAAGLPNITGTLPGFDVGHESDMSAHTGGAFYSDTAYSDTKKRWF